MSMAFSPIIAVKVAKLWPTNRLDKTDTRPKTRFANQLRMEKYFLTKTWCLTTSITLREAKISPLRTNLIFTRFISTTCRTTVSKYHSKKTSKFLIREWRPRKELVQALIVNNKRVTPIKISRTSLWRIGKICSSSQISWKATQRSRQILLVNRLIKMVLPIICLWFSQVYRISRCLRPKQISLIKEAQWCPALGNQRMGLKSLLEVVKQALLEVPWSLKDQVETRYMLGGKQIIKTSEGIHTLARLKRWTPEIYLPILETMFCTAVSELLYLNRWLDLMVKEQFTKLILSTSMVAETVLFRILMLSLVLQ